MPTVLAVWHSNRYEDGMPEDDSTIENRVYLFKDLAAAFLRSSAGTLASADDEERGRAIEALAELARISCVVADTEDDSPDRVYELVLASDAEDDDA